MKLLRPHRLAARPTVSVIVPCYNYGHFLPAAVGSALDQPGVDVDVLIVDDASPDGSVYVAHELARTDPRVRVLAHDRNVGHIATYRDGLEQATGSYVVLLSADDLVTPGSFTRATALMESRPEVVLTYGHVPWFDSSPPRPNLVARSWTIWSGSEWIKRLCVRGTNVVVNPEAMLRTSAMREVGGYDPQLPHAADMLVWMSAALRGSVGRVNGADQAFYRNHGSNMHLVDYGGLLTDMRERMRVFERVLSDPLAVGLDHDQLIHVARRGIAIEATRAANLAHDAGKTHGGSSADELAEFARLVWPPITVDRTWRALQRRRHKMIPQWQKNYGRVVDDIRARVRWRRWRRFGT